MRRKNSHTNRRLGLALLQALGAVLGTTGWRSANAQEGDGAAMLSTASAVPGGVSGRVTDPWSFDLGLGLGVSHVSTSRFAENDLASIELAGGVRYHFRGRYRFAARYDYRFSKTHAAVSDGTVFPGAGYGDIEISLPLTLRAEPIRLLKYYVGGTKPPAAEGWYVDAQVPRMVGHSIVTGGRIVHGANTVAFAVPIGIRGESRVANTVLATRMAMSVELNIWWQARFLAYPGGSATTRYGFDLEGGINGFAMAIEYIPSLARPGQMVGNAEVPDYGTFNFWLRLIPTVVMLP